MTIYFNLHHQRSWVSPYFENQLSNFLVKVAIANPGHSFIIYGAKTVDNNLPANYSVQHGPFPARGSWVKRLFIKPEASAALQFKIFTPEVSITEDDALLIADLSPLVHPQHFKSRETARLKKKLIKGITTAKALVVFSRYYHHLLLTSFNVPQQKLHYWDIGSPAKFMEMGSEEKETVKQQFTSGTEYFLFAGDLHPRHEQVTLLKAFSDFKKWQRSGMKLVFAAYESSVAQELEILLTNYKYRDDVILVKDPPDITLQQLVAAAYCVVYPALYDPFPQIIRYAMVSRVPVISSDIPEIRSIGGDGLIYAAVSVSELSPFMQRVFKDEAWRAEVISKASAGLIYQEQRFEELFNDLVPADINR
jgi:glycosyltransferase involved in cell wall biosynthesis